MIAYPVCWLTISLSIFLYVLTSEGDIRRVPRNQVLWGLFLFFVSFCALLVVLVVSERRASAFLIMLSAKQGSPRTGTIFNAFGIRTRDLPLPKRTLYHLRFRDRLGSMDQYWFPTRFSAAIKEKCFEHGPLVRSNLEINVL